jgi:hypothetical protein
MKVVFVALGLLLAPMASAQEAEQQWPGGSAMAVGKQYRENRDYFSKLLVKKHAQLMARVENKAYKFDHTRLVAAIEAQHAAYLKYVERECELVGALTGAGGSWPSTYAVKCEAVLIERRFRRVSDAVACIDRLPADKQEFGQENCLYQLAQLNMGEWRSAK